MLVVYVKMRTPDCTGRNRRRHLCSTMTFLMLRENLQTCNEPPTASSALEFHQYIYFLMQKISFHSMYMSREQIGSQKTIKHGDRGNHAC